MTRKLTIVMFVTLASSTIAHAQTLPTDRYAPLAPRFVDRVNGLTLEQTIDQALAREPGLRAVRAEIDVARGRRDQAALKPNPTVTFAQITEPAGTDSQTRVEVQWPLDLFRKTGRVTVADREVDATRAAIADRERLLIADVREKCGEVLAAIRELSIADELVAITSRQDALMAARVDAGAIPPLDRDMVRVELQRIEADRMLQVGRVERALFELKRLLGLHADAPLALREDLEQLVTGDATDRFAAQAPSASMRPDVAEAEARVHAADARIDEARRDGRFDVSLFGMYMRMDSGFAQRGFGSSGDLESVRGIFHDAGGGVMVSVPLRDRKQGDVAAAQARRVAAQAQFEARQLTADAEIAAARARDERAMRALAIYDAETRNLAKRNLDVVQQTYEAGRMTLLDVLNERRRYAETERAYTSTLREAYDARQALRTALGDIR